MTLLIVSAINDSFEIKVELSPFMIDVLNQGVWSLHHLRKMSADKNPAVKDCWQAGSCKVRPKGLSWTSNSRGYLQGWERDSLWDILVESDQAGQTWTGWIRSGRYRKPWNRAWGMCLSDTVSTY